MMYLTGSVMYPASYRKNRGGDDGWHQTLKKPGSPVPFLQRPGGCPVTSDPALLPQTMMPEILPVIDPGIRKKYKKTGTGITLLSPLSGYR
jgi:hypothetical protein